MNVVDLSVLSGLLPHLHTSITEVRGDVFFSALDGTGVGSGWPSFTTGAGSAGDACLGPVSFFTLVSTVEDSFCLPGPALFTAFTKIDMLGGSGYSVGDTPHNVRAKDSFAS